MNHVLDALRITSRMAADPAKDSGIPGLGVVLSTIAKVLEKLQTTQTTVKGVDVLLERINSLLRHISGYYSRPLDQQLPEATQRRMGELVKTWVDIADRAQCIKKGGFIGRFFTSDDDKKALEDLVDEISASIQRDFLLGGVLDIEDSLHRAQKNTEKIDNNMKIVVEDVKAVREHAETVDGNLSSMKEGVGMANEGIQKVDDNLEAVIETAGQIRSDVRAIGGNLEASFILGYARKAQYDAGGTVRWGCLNGTRVDLLAQLQGWITAACQNKDLRRENGLGSVWWINGLAGTGKTTIAYSIAEWAKEQGILGGSFFCSRFDSECSNPALVFVTIACQLCSFHEPFKAEVLEVLRNNPDVVNAKAERQFEELIVEPLEALTEPFPPCLLVFDALDECRNEESSVGVTTTSTVMEVVAMFMSRVEPFLTFLFTSRPEPTITGLFNGPRTKTLQGVTTPVVLHMIELVLVEGDIRRYLVHGFERTREEYGIHAGWPSPQDVDKLVRLASGLFIFVTTALAFIMDKAYRHPPSRLQRLVNMDTTTQSSTTILYKLYSEIIAASYTEVSTELGDKLRKVLGTIALAQEPLSVSTLASLLGFPEYEIIGMLSGLQSVLHVPIDHHDPILVIHPTFPEFVLRTPEQAAIAASPTLGAFSVQPARQHWLLFSRCLEVMFVLKRDMADLRYPAKFRGEIKGFSQKVGEAIPPYVRYACRYWADHFGKGADGSEEEVDVSDRLHSFVHARLLPWIEACFLLDIPAYSILYTASNTCSTLGGAFSELGLLLADCRRFVRAHSSVMHTAPLQLYHFALSVAPANSPFCALYSQELNHSIVVCRGAPSHWAPCLDAIKAHGGNPVYSVTFSPDGSCFASGGRENQVRIWDTATCTQLQALDGHTNDVNCVTFSPAGEYIASGSDDKTACIWQVSTGNRVHTLEHTNWVFSVAYSADGSRIFSATSVGEVKMWDTADGRCLFTLADIGNWIFQVALSSNGDVIARGEGALLTLHDVSSSSREALSLSNKVEACTFSPDDRYVAARTEHTIRVWATADKALVRSIDVPDSILCNRLAFSRDGKYIACGSKSGPVYVWQVTSEDPPCTLDGHTHWAWDVAWSPNGLQVASASLDGTIGLWDGALHSAIDASSTSEHQPVPLGAAGPPRFALVRRKGYSALFHLPSIGIEHFPTDPRLPEGAPVVAAFTDIVAACDAAYQRDGGLSSSACDWVFLTGQQSTKLGGRPVAISRDGSLMAYLSPAEDGSVDVCNLHTGAVVATLKEHTDSVYSIVFSPDGTRLATGSRDNTVKVWDATTGVLICSHAEHQDWVRATAFSSDGRFVASGSEDKSVRIFEVATERVVHVLGPTVDWVIEVTFTMDNQHVIALVDLGRVFIWEAASGAHIHSFSFCDKGWRRSLTFSSNTLGIRIHGDTGDRTIGLRRSSTLPVDFFESHRWLYAWLPGATHRVCGLPAEWRGVLGSDGDVVCLRKAKSATHTRERFIALDMSRSLSYVESLGPDDSIWNPHDWSSDSDDWSSDSDDSISWGSDDS